MPPELCDAACQKIIINSGLIAPIAELIATAAEKRGGHQLGASSEHRIRLQALVLSVASRAACTAYDVAIAQGTLTVAEGGDAWNGCDDAVYLMAIVDDLRNVREVSAEAIPKMEELTDRACRLTQHFVSARHEL